MPIPQSDLQIQAVKAISPFKLGQEVRLVEIHDAGAPQNMEGSEGLDLVAELSTTCSGELPPSNRVLNAIVMDWVDANRTMLETMLGQPVREFLTSNYPEIDSSELHTVDGIVYEDQVDYLAAYDEDSDRLHFSVELILDLEDAGPQP